MKEIDHILQILIEKPLSSNKANIRLLSINCIVDIYQNYDKKTQKRLEVGFEKLSFSKNS
jgi:hypothetical protein